MKAVRFITTYCRKNGVLPMNIQKTEETQFADNGENQIAEIWLQSYLAHQKGEQEESKV